MADKSSYLRFLPPVLWQAEPDAPEFSLGTALRIFEKLLTGIDDGVPIRHLAPDGTPIEHEAIGAIIGRLHRLFNPWTTPPEFLPWLASWVSLEFPAVWDEYQRRKISAEIVGIYRRRGLKRGLDEYLDLYAVSDKRPRVAIDEGGRVLMCTPMPGRFASIDTLVGHGPVARADNTLVHGGLMRPSSIALAPDGALYLGDAGTPTYWRTEVDEAVWAVMPPGRYDFGGTPPLPRSVGPTPWVAANPGAPVFPKAVAIDRQAPWNLYVLDNVALAAQTALYRLSSPGFAAVSQVATKAQLGLINPVAMVFDANGHLLILDRGNAANAPRVVDVQIAPLLATPHVLTQVVSPFSLTVLAGGAGGGDLVIGDGGNQAAPTPASLVHVNRAAPLWVESPLLGAVPAGANPLVAPTGVVEFRPGLLLVLDAGLKPLAPDPADPYTREIAEPAALYWVDITQVPPRITRASEAQGMVQPCGMVFDGRNVFICDAGEPEVAPLEPRVWRALDHEFAAIVHFSKQRPASVLERRRIVGNIRDIVDRNKPAHTLWTVISSV
ncbi:phage tail protein [Pelomonas sp. CA6]|uniref:phage tail protein n=1 Tax=Pelomonas sp. CA6 TaxID=2907999 RepID=UPI001F4AF711|nr:phage tail protein [Pelomonas sp. CA6]MCH7342701.1 phage tail protein [Pelomonas sp. CA6]